MNIISHYLLALSAGLLLGIFYFGVLWLTVKQIPNTRRPLLLTLGGYFLRIAATLIVFYLIVTQWDWKHLLISLLGFIAVRFMMIRQIQPQKKEL